MLTVLTFDKRRLFPLGLELRGLVGLNVKSFAKFRNY